MCSLPPVLRNDAGRWPLTVTFDTDSASDRSRVNVRSAASVTAVMVADPVKPVDGDLVLQASS